jgi:anthranilate/para-aminobenzoate synthase component II
MATEITHNGKGIFLGCCTPTKVGRYHSLVIDPVSLPPELIVTAENSDGVIMGVQHRTRPVFGVQFHPESVLTDQGFAIIGNFVDIADSIKREPAP